MHRLVSAVQLSVVCAPLKVLHREITGLEVPVGD